MREQQQQMGNEEGVLEFQKIKKRLIKLHIDVAQINVDVVTSVFELKAKLRPQLDQLNNHATTLHELGDTNAMTLRPMSQLNKASTTSIQTHLQNKRD